MIPPAAAPPSAPIPAAFSRVVNGVEQPAKAARKNISAKDLDFLIIIRVLFFLLRPDLFPPPHVWGDRLVAAGVGKRWRYLRALLATRKLHDARLLVSVTERKHGANRFSGFDLTEINSIEEVLSGAIRVVPKKLSRIRRG